MDPSLCNSMLMDPLNATDSSQCMRRLSLSLACLTSVRSECLPSCFLWCRHCSLAPDANCLSHSVDSSVLCYTVRTGVLSRDPSASHRTLKSFSTCANLKFTLPLFPCVQLKFSVYGHMQTDRQTDIHVSCNAVMLVCPPIKLDHPSPMVRYMYLIDD